MGVVLVSLPVVGGLGCRRFGGDFYRLFVAAVGHWLVVWQSVVAGAPSLVVVNGAGVCVGLEQCRLCVGGVGRRSDAGVAAVLSRAVVDGVAGLGVFAGTFEYFGLVGDCVVTQRGNGDVVATASGFAVACECGGMVGFVGGDDVRIERGRGAAFGRCGE